MIGIDQYTAWPRLHNAVSDATGAARLFMQLGFVEVTRPLFDDAATRDAMHSLVTADLASLAPDDSLVVFFAGHGHTHTTRLDDVSVKTGYVIPADAAPSGEHVAATWLRLDNWLSDIARLPPRHILVIVDACHSGVALSELHKWRDDASGAMRDLDALRARRSRRIITSALDDQRAMDGGPHSGHSLFTGCLIEALSGGLAENGQRVATGTEIGQYLQKRVTSYPHTEQTPDFGAFELDGRGDIVVPILGVGGEPAEPAEPEPPVPPADPDTSPLLRSTETAAPLSVSTGLAATSISSPPLAGTASPEQTPPDRRSTPEPTRISPAHVRLLMVAAAIAIICGGVVYKFCGGVEGAPADADGRDSFQQHYERAGSLYLSERYDEALVEFEAAYCARPLPRLLIHIGQSYLTLGKPKEALDSYNAYLQAEPNPDPETKAKVDRYIRQTQAMMDVAASTLTSAQAPASARTPAANTEETARNSDRDTSGYPTRFVTVPSGVTVDLHAIAGRAPDDLWAVGDGGALFHYDGERWAPSYKGWGGQLLRVAASRPDDVWAVGANGLCLHFDGNAWHIAPSPGEADLIGVWANGPGDAWVVDDNGTVQHFDGTDWSVPPQSGDRPEGLRLVAAGASVVPSDVRWMVGHKGTIVRWDGKTLAKMISGTQSSLFSIWQHTPEDAWATGEDGAVLHYDGKSWKAALSPSKLTLYAVWGTDSDDAWAVGGSSGGDQGVILHYDGKTWSVAAEALPIRLRALWGTGPRDVFAAGAEGAIYHYDGDAWTEMPRRTRATLYGLWGTSATDVWAVGDGGMVVHYDGRTWSTRWRGTRGTFHAVWETATDDVWAVGEDGAILHRDAKGWSGSDSGTTTNLRAVWASDAKDAWAAGDDGVLLHWDGAAWSAHKSGLKNEKLTTLWGMAPDDVWAGGEYTVLLHYDGHSWTEMPHPLTGGAPRPPNIRFPTVTSIWGAAANDIWAVGDKWFTPRRAILLHYDGTRWSSQPSTSLTGLKGVVASSPNDVWGVGANFAVHYDGKTWHTTSGTDAYLEGVWSGGGEVWAVGKEGKVLKLRGK